MNTARPLPIKDAPATLRDILAVQSTLTDLLDEESGFMTDMQLGKVGELQDRKLKLTGMLERYMRHFKQNPAMFTDATAEEKAELKESAERFNQVMKHNYETLLVARAVNKTVVKCVTQIVTRKDQNPIYNARGTAKPSYRPLPISITLNETV